MARLLVVSRSMALALRLADAHEVVELGVDEVGAMLPGPEVDAVVLDVADPAVAVRTVDRLRGVGCATPLLVVSGYQPAWSGLGAVAVPGVVVVPLPITRTALLDGIEVLLTAVAAQGAPSDGAGGPGASPGRAPSSSGGPAGGAPSSEQDRPSPGWAGSGFDWWRIPEGPTDLPDPDDDGPARPLRRGWPPGSGTSALARLAVEAARTQTAPAQVVPAQGCPTTGRADDARRAPVTDLVDELIERAAELRSVPDAAASIAGLFVERAGATAAAVLVPEGRRWHVEGGVGLRPTERHAVLDRAHRLVEDVVAGERPLVVSGDDEIREHLDGAPLAAWRHLLALPVPRVEAAVVLARGGEGQSFSPDEVTGFAELLHTAAGLLGQALQARRLARLLAPLSDPGPSL